MDPILIGNVLPQLMNALSKLGYPDTFRIAQEIIEFANSTESAPSFATILDELESQKPWEYIRGFAEFHGLRFFVTPDVLIPRIETEVLVDKTFEVIRELLNTTHNQLNIVDVGTGSGAILLSLLDGLNEDQVPPSKINLYGIDISNEALDIAEQNLKSLFDPIKYSVVFLKSDALENVSEINTDLPTIIVTNPPYIKAESYDSLDPSVANWEPKLALVDTEPEGLGVSRRIVEQAIMHFTKLHSIHFELDLSNVKVLESEVKDRFTKTEIGMDQFDRERFLSLYV